ncbi:MAG: acyl-CoA dehydrogenase [Verrucomicrobia bacterium]|nr:MAG: acyl-CoA dehydrogenase [Verrucomicrobiota bacterium]
MQRETLREKQVREAEELLFAGPQKLGFAKGLFLGKFISRWVMPYPGFSPEEEPGVERAVREVREFLDRDLDPVAIDRQADIPGGVIERLGQLGLLGMTAPTEAGGKGFSQMAYCRVMEEVGARCGSTAVFINAHHSIGMRALLLFGTPEQKQRWLPDLVSGRKLAAFALTEPEAGSDAGNVQTQAQPSADGSHYILNGKKRYITNAAIAQVLTVMARTPVPGKTETAITAFLVTPDMPGYELTEARMEKLGIRGTVTGRLAFHDMPVPKENILGPVGKGLKVALTVLDFGRTTFGACSTGAAKFALALAIRHANSRRQFGRTLGEFELVKKKIARMAASVYAMEAMTTVTASLIDRGLEDYMAETAMLKVFTTEALWEIVNDSFQIHGGSAYFTDSPLERMLRDTRINLVAEGANEILTSFIALVGLRGPGEQFRELRDALQHPGRGLGRAWRLGLARVGPVLSAPEVPVSNPDLAGHASRLGKLVHSFNLAADRSLIRHKEEILERQYVHERLARAAIEIFASACVLSRWDKNGAGGAPGAGMNQIPDLFLRGSGRRVRHHLSELRDNEDAATTATADWVLKANSNASNGELDE